MFIPEASLRSTLGWQMACHSCFRPDEVDCTVNETLAVSVFTFYLFYVLSDTPVELLDIQIRLLLSSLLAHVCTVPMLSKSEKILMSLNKKQKSLCRLETTQLFAQRDKETGNSKKTEKACLGLMS